MAAGGARIGERGWYYGWKIFGALTIGQMAANGPTFSSLSPFLSRRSEDLHAPVSEFALAVGALLAIVAILLLLLNDTAKSSVAAQSTNPELK